MKKVFSLKIIKSIIIQILLILIVFYIGTIISESAVQGISIEYKCGKADEKSQSLRPYVKIYNNSDVEIDLSNLMFRYYYIKEGTAKEILNSYYVAIGAENLICSFYPELGYAQICFKSGTGILKPGEDTGEIQISLEKETTGYYDQTNDYSFNPSFTDFGVNEKITLYHNDEIVFGYEGPEPPQPPEKPSSSDDWLHVEGNKVKDRNGNVVRLTGINWFGYETDGSNGFYGLDKCNLEEGLDTMAELGFNILRLPISAEIILDWKKGDYVNTSFVSTYENPYLDGLNSLEIIDYTIDYVKRTGMKIMIDMHSSSKDAYQENLWYNSSISSAQFLEAWKWIVERYKNDDTIVAVDLKNEPHGKYSGSGIAKWDGSNDSNNWRKAAEDIGNALLRINPNILIIVEGVESYPMEGYDYTNCGEFTTYTNWWGSNLRGVSDYPVLLSDKSKLVYSVHDYGPDIYVQPWFYEGFTKTTLYNDCWQPNWFYIVENNIAPVFVGEWGGKLENADNRKWFSAFAQFAEEKGLHHTFWSFNPNSGDTGGIMLDDWKTVDTEKYNIVKSSLWMEGLDHEVSLGAAEPIVIPEPTHTVRPSPSQQVSASPSPTGRLGDVDNDGSVNIIDALKVAQHYVGNTPDDFDSTKADMNQDVNIDIIDALLISQYYVDSMS